MSQITVDMMVWIQTKLDCAMREKSKDKGVTERIRNSE